MVTKLASTVWKPLGKQTESKMGAHDIICLHTMVGYLKSTETMFARDGYTGTESHFGVGGKWGSDFAENLDGIVWQFQDLDYSADANLEGNWHVISIETADNAPKSADDLAEWTPKQITAIVKLVASLCKQYNIPATLIPDTKRGRRGIAFHAQGIEPRLVSGGEKWSSARGKVCPGDRRIAQLKNIIIPGVQAALKGKDWFDMATPEDLKKAIAENNDALVEKIWNSDRISVATDATGKPDPKNPTWQADSVVANVLGRQQQMQKQLDDQDAKLNAILAALTPKA